MGLNTITDFLQKKGIKSDGSPNTLVDAETYAVLEKEFGSNRSAASARDSIRERISQKQTTITLEEAKKQEREEEKEVVIKSNVISVKDEIPQPKFLGKIDLSPKPKAAPQPAPAPFRRAEGRSRAGSRPAPARNRAAFQTRSGRSGTPAARPKPPAAGKRRPAAERPAPARRRAENAQAPQPSRRLPHRRSPATRASNGQPVAKRPPACEEEAPKDNIFRPETVTLTGPQVLGTMDVSGFVPGGKHKRKRLQKEKVDVTKAQKGGAGRRQPSGQGGQGTTTATVRDNQGQNRGGQGQNQPRPGEGRRNKNKNAPKPIVRPEVSDEEVSKQIKDTLARLTAKGAKSKVAKYRKDKREAVAERMNESSNAKDGTFDPQGYGVRNRERTGHDDERLADGGHHGLHEPRTDGVDQPAARRRGAGGRRRGVRLQGRIRLGGDSGGHRRRPARTRRRISFRVRRS